MCGKRVRGNAFMRHWEIFHFKLMDFQGIYSQFANNICRQIQYSEKHAMVATSINS